jgi:peptidyl-prolyl cis-trans isomerase B (cyclophilin B)
MKRLPIILLIFILISFTSCEDKYDYMVIIHTEYGDMKALLYNETPLHKQNFIQLAKEGKYDSTIWHRVIKDFMIQGGDFYSIAGEKEPVNARIKAEIVDGFLHTKGALAAARQGDQMNPQKMSSSCQFYIVDGRVFSEQEMTINEYELNQGLNQLLQKDGYDSLYQRFVEVSKERDRDKMKELSYQCVGLVEEELGIDLSQEVSPERLEAYTSIGGAPHLDNEYTVFGRIVEGLDVIDKIADVEIGMMNRPEKPTYLTMEVVKVSKKEITKKYGYEYPKAK